MVPDGPPVPGTGWGRHPGRRDAQRSEHASPRELRLLLVHLDDVVGLNQRSTAGYLVEDDECWCAERLWARFVRLDVCCRGYSGGLRLLWGGCNEI